MREITRDQRFDEILGLIPREASTAVDVGCGISFRDVYVKSGRLFDRVLGLNVHAPSIRDLTSELRESHPHYSFICADATEYPFDAEFDVATLLAVAEHLTLYDLTKLLDRLAACCGTMVLETPEQYEPNEWAVKAFDNPHERHLSLVTAEFLSQWSFRPAARYWLESGFSDCIYVRSEHERNPGSV